MVLNFLIAGRDTTAQAMSWCLFLLMRSEQVQEKVRSEIHQVCGDVEGLDYEKLGNFHYLEAVLRESLRLYPSVPLDLKFVSNADTLPDGTHVPRGSALIYGAYAMGRSREIWGPDASEFRPERWLEMDQVKSPYENPVFHAGPRECLGKRLAMLEMKAMLVSLLRNFRLHLAAGTERCQSTHLVLFFAVSNAEAVAPETITPDAQVTIGMSSGLRCRVEPL